MAKKVTQLDPAAARWRTGRESRVVFLMAIGAGLKNMAKKVTQRVGALSPRRAGRHGRAGAVGKARKWRTAPSWWRRQECKYHNLDLQLGTSGSDCGWAGTARNAESLSGPEEVMHHLSVINLMINLKFPSSTASFNCFLHQSSCRSQDAESVTCNVGRVSAGTRHGPWTRRAQRTTRKGATQGGEGAHVNKYETGWDLPGSAHQVCLNTSSVRVCFIA
eukprot:365252-Chlamydomonas_euryale.AAC.53